MIKEVEMEMKEYGEIKVKERRGRGKEKVQEGKMEKREGDSERKREYEWK